jgi:hypothetical protein
MEKEKNGSGHASILLPFLGRALGQNYVCNKAICSAGSYHFRCLQLVIGFAQHFLQGNNIYLRAFHLVD